MINVLLVKDIGLVSGLNILDKIVRNKYGANSFGVTTHFGPSSDSLVVHLEDGQATTEADTAMAAIELPTCTHSALDITVNVGTYIVNDVTAIVADGAETKFAKVSIAVDNTTGAPEVYIFEKTTGVYGDLPAGKTFATDLKEYSVVASGTALTEINNWIQ